MELAQKKKCLTPKIYIKLYIGRGKQLALPKQHFGFYITKFPLRLNFRSVRNGNDFQIQSNVAWTYLPPSAGKWGWGGGKSGIRDGECIRPENRNDIRSNQH